MEIDESETVKSLSFMKRYLKGRLKNIMAIYLIRGATLLWRNLLALWMRSSALSSFKKIKTSNSLSSTKVALEFRIGINTGDVIKEKEIY